jgi:NAD(P)-dependent dehydrogenase (short-subunit alcohol dehydrogenase family)
MKLQDAVIIVTGASRGIGKALVTAFESEGATVIGCSRSGNEDTRVVDVSDPDAVSALVHSVIDEHGRVDVLINNAGVIHQYHPLEEISLEDYTKCIDCNIGSVFYGMRSVLAHMKKNNSGIIINIGSMAGTVSHPNISVYSATKFAVLGLTQTVAKELNDDNSAVLCINVSPGGTDTDMRKELLGEEASKSQNPEIVARIVSDILTEKIAVENGMNVQIVRGEISAKVSMQ